MPARWSSRNFCKWQTIGEIISRFRRAIVFRAALLRGFLKHILNMRRFFLMQSEQDASRLLELGAEPKRVIVAGNLKYDLGDRRRAVVGVAGG